MNITIRQLQAFVAVAELGSFTRAAERLNVAQPALSQLVRELERELGLRLFDRTTRRVELTEGGREFRVAAGTLLADLDHAVRQASDIAGRRRGRLAIAAPPLLAAAVLPRAIAEFAEAYPGIDVSLMDWRTGRIVDNVRAGRVDAGLGTFPPSEQGLRREPLARDSLMLFCPAASAFAGREAVAWAELAGQPIITLTRDSGIRLLVEVGFEAAELPLAPRFEVAQITTALALVESGLGLAVLPTYARAVLRSSGIVVRLLVEPTIARDIVLIRAAGRSASPALEAFEPVLRRALRRLASEDGGEG